MDLEKLKPWNWFKHEEGASDNSRQVPVNRNQTDVVQAGPTGSLMRLHEDMDRWFDHAFKSFGLPSLANRFDSLLPAFRQPKIDISGDDNCYQINLDVPGLSEDDLSLEVRNDVLVIKGQKEDSKEDKEKHYYRVERSYGAFQRTLSLPDDANGEEIRASLDKGVLRLEIPRLAEHKQDVKRIQITS